MAALTTTTQISRFDRVVDNLLNSKWVVFGAGVAAGVSLMALWDVITRPRPARAIVAHERFRSREEFLKILEAQFHVTSRQLYDCMNLMIEEMEAGLAGEPSSLKMLPSYVSQRCTGTESGKYLALDLGGTNFRVVLVTLEGNGHVVRSQSKHVVSQELQEGSGEALFDFLAQCIGEFLATHGIPENEQAHLGFTFSFPVDQKGLNKGNLVVWTKGFSATGVVGHDVVQLLNAALARRGIRVNVAALVNDTVGTLIAHSYHDRDVVCGVILGTGTNAAYVERVDNIPKWTGGPVASGEMIVNMEWGGFGSTEKSVKVLPITAYDRLLDSATPNPHQQIFEKLISGMYLGELTRLVIVDLVRRGHLFGGKASGTLLEEGSFDTSLMSRIERDHSAQLRDTDTVLVELLGIANSTFEEREIVKRVCELIGIRAARLAAMGVAAVLKKTNRQTGATVAIDGSVFEHYPHFRNRMQDALRELFGVSAEDIVLSLARDGSGTGAALVAAMAAKAVN